MIGGSLVGHATNSAYGTFGVVLGLLAWFYLQAQITLYCVELDVVRALRLWPRSLAPPPLTEADMRAYQLYAESDPAPARARGHGTRGGRRPAGAAGGRARGNRDRYRPRDAPASLRAAPPQ